MTLGAGDDRLPAGTTLTLGDSAVATTVVFKIDGRNQTLAGLLKVGSGNASVVNGNAAVGTLTLNIGSGTNSFAGILGGTGAYENNLNLTKIGAGTLALTQINTFTGVAAVNNGTLLITADGNLGGSSATLLLNSGTLASNTTFTLNSGRSLLVGAGVGTVDVGSGKTLTFGGVIGDKSGETGILAKTGLGTLTLSGANGYTGTTQIKNGALTLGAANALPADTILTLGNTTGNTTGTFKLNSYNQTVAGLATAGTGTANRIVNGNSITSTLTINNATDGAFGGILGGPGTYEDNFAVIKTGVGTLTLSGTNTFAGNLTVSTGTLKLANNLALPFNTNKGNIQIDGTLDLNNQSIGLNGLSGSGIILSSTLGTPTITLGYNNQSSIFSGTIQNGSATSVAVTKTGTGILTLSGANLYTGVTTVSGGTLKIGNSAALPFGVGKGDVALTGGVLDLNGTSITINGLSGTSGINSSAVGAPVLSVGGNNASSSYGGVITNLTGTVGLTKIGTGTLTLSATSNYTGTTTIKNGMIAITANSALPSGSVLTLGDSDTNDAGILKLNQRTLTLAGIQTAGGGTSRIISGTSSAGAVLTINNTANFTYAGILGGPGSYENNFGFTKTGTGTLTLSNINTYTGATTVSGGTLKLGSDSALPNAGNLTVNTSTLDINGYSLIVRNLAGSGTVVNNAAGTNNLLTVTSQANSNFTGVIANTTGTISLNKIGTSTLTLSGVNTYLGTTTISQGTLAINADTGLGTGSLAINDGAILSTPSISFSLNANRGIAVGPTSGTGTATFDIATTKTLTYNGAIANNGTGTGAFVKANTGYLILGGTASSYSGGTLVNAGLLAVTATEAAASGGPLGANVTGNNVFVAAGANLSLSNTSNKGSSQIFTVTSSGAALGGIGFSKSALTQTSLTSMFNDSTGANGGVLGVNTAYSR